MVAGFVLMLLLESAVFLAVMVAGFVLVILAVPGLSRDEEVAGEPGSPAAEAGPQPTPAVQPSPAALPTSEQPTMVQAPPEPAIDDEHETVAQTAAPAHEAYESYDDPLVTGPVTELDGDDDLEEADATDVPPAVAMADPPEGGAGQDAVATPWGTDALQAPPQPAARAESMADDAGALVRGLGERAKQRPAGVVAAVGALVGVAVWLRRARS